MPDDDDVHRAFGDIFSEFFGARQIGPPRGADLRVDLELELVEMVDGCTRELAIGRDLVCEACTGTRFKPDTPVTDCKTCVGSGVSNRTQGQFFVGTSCGVCAGRGKLGTLCATCRGEGLLRSNDTLSITVPAGVSDGQTLRLPGKGSEAAGGETGHLYVVLAQRLHPRLVRRDDDLLVDAPISRELAATGGTVTVPDLRGEREITVPPNSKDGDQVVVRGFGSQILTKPPTPLPVDAAGPYRAPDLSGRGDLIVTLRIAKTGWLKKLLGR